LTPLRLIVATLGVTIVLAACSAASTVSPRLQVPASVPVPKIPEPGRQLGIDIDFYAYPGIHVAALAQQDVAYIKSLHANVVSVSFPFFSNRPGTTIKATNRTPSITQLGQVIVAAERAGLAVTLRPLLDENSIGKSRPIWKPANLTVWFADYLRFLIPYAELAQRDHVATFIVGAEFTQFSAARQWDSLDRALRAVYKGTLAYSNNWTTFEHPMPGNGGTGVTEMIDAYPPVNLPDNATPAALMAAWIRWARPLPKGTVFSELGIAALPGAYLHPYRWNPASTALTPQIQVNWFDAACHAVTADHTGGLYFWSLNFGQSLTTPANISDPISFVDTPGAAAIAKCFLTLGKTL
jgi:hypothetical protein